MTKALHIYVCIFIEREDSLWHLHFTRTLRAMGHKVFIPPDIGLQQSWYICARGEWTKRYRREITDRILGDVKKIKVQEGLDLFFCYLFPFQFEPSLFKELKNLGIPSAYFFCDNLQYKDVAEEYAPYATLNWVPESRAMAQFKASGSRAVHLPMASNPELTYPIDTEKTVDISFVGSKNAHRCLVLGRLAREGIDLAIAGPWWHQEAEELNAEEEAPCKESMFTKRTAFDMLSVYVDSLGVRCRKLVKDPFRIRKRRPADMKLDGKEEAMLAHAVEKGTSLCKIRAYPPSGADFVSLNNMYNMSRINILFNDQSYRNAVSDGITFHSNLRNFEAAMAGGCCLVQATPDICECFEDGKEIVVFSTADELIDKAKDLLKNEDVCKKLRVACLKRALGEHTWTHRFTRLFSLLPIG